MSKPTPSSERDELDKILWPSPFSGSGTPVQVAVSSGLPPEGKTFVVPYSVAKMALNHQTEIAQVRYALEVLEKVKRPSHYHDDGDAMGGTLQHVLVSNIDTAIQTQQTRLDELSKEAA
jgi:hypothetical protein